MFNQLLRIALNDLQGSVAETTAVLGFQDGSSQTSAAAPVVQTQVNEVASVVPINLSYTVPQTATYQVTFYYGASGLTGTGYWSPVVNWTDPSGNSQNLAYPYMGNSNAGDPTDFQSFSIPCFCLGGTPIAVTGAYSDTPFPMNISIKVVVMP